MGKWQNNFQNLYMHIENKFLIIPVFAPFWGEVAHFTHFEGILTHLAAHNGQIWGISHLCWWPESYGHFPLPCGSIWSFFHGFRFIHLYQSYSCRAACQVLHKSNLSQLRASSKLIPTARQQSSLSSSSDIQYIPRTINTYIRYHMMFRYCVRDGNSSIMMMSGIYFCKITAISGWSWYINCSFQLWTNPDPRQRPQNGPPSTLTQQNTRLKQSNLYEIWWTLF